MNSTKVVIVAHNDCEVVKVQIEFMIKISGFSSTDFIIVDNYSDDGLSQWLSIQKDMDYIICDERVEDYAKIINTVIGEFIRDEDVLILRPDMLLLPECLRELKNALLSLKNGGIVCPYVLRHGVVVITNDIQVAIEEAEKDSQGREFEEHIGANNDVFLVRNEVLKQLKKFDETVKFPRNILADLCLSLIELGYHCYGVNKAYAYRFANNSDIYEQILEENIDRQRMKEKWGMNYFNENPNLYLLSRIKDEKERLLYILEIGCDCGANLLWLKNRYPNAELFGVELNPKSAKIANHFVNTQVGNVEEKKLDFGNIKFDYIIFGDVLEHLKNPAGAISYCKGLLAPEGKVIASIPNLMHYSVLQRLLNGYFSYSDIGLLDRTHIHFFTYYENKDS